MVVTRIYFYRLSNGKSTLSVSLGPIVSPLIYASKDVMASNFEAPLSIMWMTTKMLPNFNNKCCVSCLVSNKRSPSGHRETKKNEKLNAYHVPAADKRIVSKSLSRSCLNHTKPFRPCPTVKLLRIMLRNRCRPTTFHIITARDDDGWCHKWLV